MKMKHVFRNISGVYVVCMLFNSVSILYCVLVWLSSTRTCDGSTKSGRSWRREVKEKHIASHSLKRLKRNRFRVLIVYSLFSHKKGRTSERRKGMVTKRGVTGFGSEPDRLCEQEDRTSLGEKGEPEIKAFPIATWGPTLPISVHINHPKFTAMHARVHAKVD